MSLREAIATKLQLYYGLERDPQSEITVTLGATEAIYSAIQAAVGPGDEVIAFDPAYDSYEPAVRLAGARCIRLPLTQPGFRYDWERVRASAQRAHATVIFNSPHNPACVTAAAEDLEALAALTRDTGHPGPVRRGLRARGVRRCTAPFGAEPPRACAAQLRGVLLRQDPACDGAAHRLLRGARASDPGAAQGAPVQHLQHRPSAAAGHRRLPGREARRGARPGALLPGQARPPARRPGRLGLRAAAGAGHLLPAAGLQRAVAGG